MHPKRHRTHRRQRGRTSGGGRVEGSGRAKHVGGRCGVWHRGRRRSRATARGAVGGVGKCCRDGEKGVTQVWELDLHHTQW